MLLTNNFIPYTFAPTRITEKTATAIDHFYWMSKHHLNSINCKISTGNIIYDISDHLTNYFILESKQKVITTSNRPIVRIFSEKAKQNFVNKALVFDWNTCLIDRYNPSEMLNLFYDKLIQLYEESFPLITLSRKCTKDKLWFTKGLSKSCNTKQKLYKQWLLSRNSEDKEKYLSFNKIYKKILKLAEHQYYMKIFDRKSNSIKNI